MELIKDFKETEQQSQDVRPSIKPFLLAMQSLFLTLVIYLIVGWFIGGIFIVIFALIFGNNIGAALLSGVVIFILIWIIVYQVRKATLKRTVYKFYDNKLEYFEGFLVKNRKTIAYDRVTNVGQRKGIVEGWFGLGTIYIDTAGSSQKGHEVAMSYLENPDQLYDWISKVVTKK